jgi:hypothetical protein
MKKYIIPIIAALTLAPISEAHLMTKLSFISDKITILEIFGDSAVPLKSIKKSPAASDELNTPLKTLVDLLESYQNKDSLASQKLRSRPAQGWLSFYKTEQCKTQADLLDEKFKSNELRIREDSLSSDALIYLKKYKFRLEPIENGEDYTWRLR